MTGLRPGTRAEDGMLTLYDFHESTFTAGRPLFVACGFFDGVHRGHQALLAQTRRLADDAGGRAAALSFSPHPLELLAPAQAPALLSPVNLRLKLLAENGMDGCILLNFDRAMSALPPAGFIDFLFGKFPNICGLVSGTDWRFGCRQAGDAEILRTLAAERAFSLTVLPPVLHAGEKISSSRIRAELRAGNLDAAAAMLGRPFTVLGEVRPGRQIGRTLGVPTANLLPPGKNPLPPGSYAARAVLDDGTAHPASAYAGSRPTYQDTESYYVECHLLDGKHDLYGRELRVEFLRQIRPEMKFRSETELRERIHADLDAAREFFRINRQPMEERTDGQK